MALPTISNNSPVAGSIAWTGFNIAYNGVQYAVAASNTAESFVIWVYNNGTPTILKTSVFPSGLTADDQILFLNKGGVGALVPMTDVLDGSLVVPGSIIANAIAANTIQSYHVNANAINAIHIQANTITATEIQANAITGDELAFNSVTTEHLGIGSVGNSLIVNGSFEEVLAGVPTGWLGDAGGTNGTMTAVTGIATSGTNCVRLSLPATTDKIYLKQKNTKYIPVTSISGRSWYISAKLGGNVATTDGLYIRAVWYDANKQYITWSNITAEDNSVVSDKAITTTFTTYEGQATPPSTARYMSVEISVQLPNVPVNVYIDEVMAREVVISAVIGDGQISTPKIMTNAIVANHIGSNIIQANHIVGNSITTDKLVVGDFTNLIPNAQLQSDTTGWSPVNATLAAVTTAGGLPGLKVTSTSSVSEADAYAQWVDVIPGEKVRLSYATEGVWSSGNAAIYAQKKTASGTITSFSPGVTGATVPNPNHSYVVTMPSDAVQVRFRPYISASATAGSYAIFSNMIARRMNGGELIVDGAITTTHMNVNSINANVLSINSITTNLIGANQITTVLLNSNSVTSNEIAGNAITAKHIGAGSISANKLLIGSAVNGLTDPSFMNPDLTALREGRSTGGTAGWTLTSAAASIPYLQRTTTTTGDTFHYTPASPLSGSAANGIQVASGQKWRMEVDVETDISAGVRWNVYKYNSDGTVTYTSLSGYSTAVGKRTLAYTYTIPDGVVAIDAALACNTAGVVWKIYGGGIIALQSSSTLIEDGAVTTTLLAANSVVSNKIATNAITANHINANAITAIHIKTNALDGKIITGSTVQTAATGARIVMNSSGLNGWDANNVNYLTADSSGLSVTGTVTAQGDNTVNYLNLALGPRTSSVRAGLNVVVRPGLSFYPDGESSLNPTRVRAGVISSDGITISMQGGEPAGYIPDGSPTSTAAVSVSQSSVSVFHPGSTFTTNGGTINMNAGTGSASLIGRSLVLQGVNSSGIAITSGGPVTFAKTAGGSVDITGVATINGKDAGVTDISYYEATGSKANFDTVNQAIGTPTYISGSSTANLGTSGGGQITLTDGGLYSVSASLNLYSDSGRTSLKAATGRSFIDIADVNGNAWSRTALPVGEDQTTGCLTGIKLYTNSVIKFNIIQTTGGTAYYKVRIWLTRIG